MLENICYDILIRETQVCSFKILLQIESLTNIFRNLLQNCF